MGNGRAAQGVIALKWYASHWVVLSGHHWGLGHLPVKVVGITSFLCIFCLLPCLL